MITGLQRVHPDHTHILRRWARTALPWVLLAVAAWLILDRVVLRSAPVAAGVRAPQLSAQMADGTAFDLASHRDGVVVLSFWATWCPACRDEAPTLSRVHRRLQRQGGTVIGLSVDRGDLSEIERAARELGMTYPIARPDQETLRRYHVTQLPTTVVVAPDGQVLGSFVGEVSEADLEQVIARAASTKG